MSKLAQILESAKATKVDEVDNSGIIEDNYRAIFNKEEDWEKMAERYGYGLSRDPKTGDKTAVKQKDSGLFRIVGRFYNDQNMGWVSKPDSYAVDYIEFYNKEVKHDNLVIMHWRVWNDHISHVYEGHGYPHSAYNQTVIVLKNVLEKIAEEHKFNIEYWKRKQDGMYILKFFYDSTKPAMFPTPEEAFDLTHGYNIRAKGWTPSAELIKKASDDFDAGKPTNNITSLPSSDQDMKSLIKDRGIKWVIPKH